MNRAPSPGLRSSISRSMLGITLLVIKRVQGGALEWWNGGVRGMYVLCYGVDTRRWTLLGVPRPLKYLLSLLLSFSVPLDRFDTIRYPHMYLYLFLEHLYLDGFTFLSMPLGTKLKIQSNDATIRGTAQPVSTQRRKR